jgi:hypothetical protein
MYVIHFLIFLSGLYSLLGLNVDLFQPFKHLTYSVGAIYSTIHNLPRHGRNLIENTILVGVIPGRKEPHYSLNSYLTPLVNELKSGWSNGFQPIDFKGVPITVRVALGCANGDIPASPKVCGFCWNSLQLDKAQLTIFASVVPKISDWYKFSYYNSYFICSPNQSFCL